MTELEQAIEKIVLKVYQNDKPKIVEDLNGETWNIDDFRKHCCGGKSKEWVRTKIFDRYPEVDVKNGGFVVNPRRGNQGSNRTIIFAKQAKDWIEKHKYEINFNEKLE